MNKRKNPLMSNKALEMFTSKRGIKALDEGLKEESNNTTTFRLTKEDLRAEIELSDDIIANISKSIVKKSTKIKCKIRSIITLNK